jgi:hypothetical protein
MKIKTAEEMLESTIEEELMEVMECIEINKQSRKVKVDIRYSKNIQILTDAGYKINDIETHYHKYLISW